MFLILSVSWPGRFFERAIGSFHDGTECITWINDFEKEVFGLNQLLELEGDERIYYETNTSEVLAPGMTAVMPSPQDVAKNIKHLYLHSCPGA